MLLLRAFFRDTVCIEFEIFVVLKYQNKNKNPFKSYWKLNMKCLRDMDLRLLSFPSLLTLNTSEFQSNFRPDHVKETVPYFVKCSGRNYLLLNVNKTTEMVVNFIRRRPVT